MHVDAPEWSFSADPEIGVPQVDLMNGHHPRPAWQVLACLNRLGHRGAAVSDINSVNIFLGTAKIRGEQIEIPPDQREEFANALIRHLYSCSRNEEARRIEAQLKQCAESPRDRLQAILDAEKISTHVDSVLSVAPDGAVFCERPGMSDRAWVIRHPARLKEATRLFALYKKESPVMPQTTTAAEPIKQPLTTRALDYGGTVLYRLAADELVELFTPIIADIMAGSGKGQAHNRKRDAIADGLRSPFGKAFVSGALGHLAPMLAPVVNLAFGDQTEKINALAAELKIQAGTRAGKELITKVKAAIAPQMDTIGKKLAELPAPQPAANLFDLDVERAKARV